MSKGDISESIKVYIRERPQLIGSEAEEAATSNVPSDQVSGIKNVSANKKSCTYYSATSKLQQEFLVDHYFEPSTQQNNVFDTIALPIVESALLGYSGTILAYGPTSSGKTHTMRGSGETERGIMPR
jgi:chromosomal replication initiation ATPase DnaA